MSSNEHLEQPIWELIYELLSPEEEAALLERITSEPEMARAYAKVKLQSDLVATAAKCDDTGGRVVPPGEEIVENPSVASGSPARSDRNVVAPPVGTGGERWGTRRVANWVVAIAAMGLLMIAATALMQMRSPVGHEIALTDATPASQPTPQTVRTVVTAPPVWNEDTTNFISVRTSSLDGMPVATPFEVKLYDGDGEVQRSDLYRTDATGAAQVALTGARAARAARVEVAARDDVSPPLSTSAQWVRGGHLTHLTTDLPVYEPGGTISYRSLSLSRFDQRVVSDVDVEFDVLDPQGVPVAGARHVVATQRGVGDGTFHIPEDVNVDKLTVLARSPGGEFPEQRRDVQVRPIEVTHWHKSLQLARESYEPGDSVEARLSVKTHDGQPAAGKKLSLTAIADQQPIPLEKNSAITDAEGNFTFQFSLPKTATLGDASVAVSIADDQAEEKLIKPIPLHTGRVEVQFFAEGGEFVAGLKNHVYFQARDLQGKPVHLEGRVVDDSDHEITRAVTAHAGRGRFAVTTEPNAAYRLVVEKPAGAQQEFALPAVSMEANVVLDSAGQVLEAAQDLRVELRMRQPDRPLVLAAACHGRLVGLQAIEESDFTDASDGTSACQRSLALASDASGVIRVTVYDATHVPPAPVAERLVYRRPARRWQVDVEPLEAPRPGQEIALELQTRNEHGEPAAATLGLSLVNQAVLNMVEDRPANLETHVFLTSELPGAEEMENANFFVGAGDESAEAMDLLLGTQGWRRFEPIGLEQMALAKTPADKYAQSLSYFEGARTANLDESELALVSADPLVPIVLDNREAIENQRAAVSQTATTKSRGSDLAHESQMQRFWGTVLLAGGILVLIAVLGQALARSLGRPRMWVPSVAVAGIAAVLGFFWLAGSPLQPPSDLALAPTDGQRASSRFNTEAAGTAIDGAEWADREFDSPVEQEVAPAQQAEGLGAVDLAAPGLAGDAPMSSSKDEKQLGQAGLAGESKHRGPAGRGLGGGLGGGAPQETTRAFRGGERDMAANPPPSAPKSGGAAAAERGRSLFRGDAKPMAAPAASPEPSTSAEPSAAPATSPAQAAPEPVAPAPVAPAPTAPDAPTSAPAPTRSTQSARQSDGSVLPRPEAAPQAQGSEGSTSAPAPNPDQTVADESSAPALKAMQQPGRYHRYRRVYAYDVQQAGEDRRVPSTLLWQPLVITDAEGRATVTVQLPATDATYLLRADAHGDGRVGSGQAIINVREP